MALNVKQVYDANPTTIAPSGALIYLALSPFSSSNNSAITFSNFKASLNSAFSGDLSVNSSSVATVSSIGGKSISLANSFTTSGNFAVTQTYTALTNVTFPTSGTLLASGTAGTTGQLLIGVTAGNPIFGSVIGANTQITKSSVGGTTFFNVNNTDGSSGASEARITIDTAAGGGNAYINFGVGSNYFSVGNLALSNIFRITNNTSLSAGSSLLEITNAGNISVPSGDFSISRSASATTVNNGLSNTNNANSASHALQTILTGGASGGDPFTSYSITGVQTYSTGIDNSDSDNFKISASSALGTSDSFVMTPGGQITLPRQSSFSAYVSALVPNVTGNGDFYTVIYDTEISDINGDYNNTTGIFTAPVTGWFYFSGNAGIYNINGGHTLCSVNLSTTSYNYYQDIMSPATARSSTNELTLPFSQKVYLTAGDTVKVIIQVSNDSKTVGSRGNASPDIFAYFSGGLCN